MKRSALSETLLLVVSMCISLALRLTDKARREDAMLSFVALSLCFPMKTWSLTRTTGFGARLGATTTTVSCVGGVGVQYVSSV